MKISTILDKKGNNVYSISSDKTLKDMVEQMLLRSIGCLLVLDDNEKIEGIITERDFLHSVKNNPSTWESISVDTVMTKGVYTTPPDTNLDEVMELMTKKRVRHMPVVESDKVVGVLSIGDIVDAFLNELSLKNELLQRYIKDWPA